MDHADSDVDTLAPPPVSNLRSKFEQLSRDPGAHRPTSFHPTYLLPESGAPRPRAASNSSTSSQTSTDAPPLRASSSSSDLKTGIKRRPPPLPPAAGKAPSPSPSRSPTPSPGPSPSVHPVMVPSVSLATPASAPALASEQRQSPFTTASEEVEEAPVPRVASLRNKFRESPMASIGRVPSPSPSPTPSPGPSPSLHPVMVPSAPPAIPTSAPVLTSEQRRSPFVLSSEGEVSEDVQVPTVASLRNKFLESPVASSPRSISPRRSLPGLACGTSDDTSQGGPKPAIPPRPRPRKSADATPPETASPPASTLSSSSSRLSLQSPDEESDHSVSAPPALPARKPTMHLHSHHAKQQSYDSVASTSSLTSTDSDVSHKVGKPPPRPPPRYRASMMPVESPSGSTSSSTPPPLPVRRNTAAPAEDFLPPPHAPPPRVPIRPYVVIPHNHHRSDIATASPITEPKASRTMPPPPTRTIALGDKLPPARRPPTPSSDEDSGEEDDPGSQLTDKLPDTSRSSRRPPSLEYPYSPSKILVPAYVGRVLVSGTHAITATEHKIHIYDLSVSEDPVISLSTKDLGSKDVKITCMEFRATSDPDARGIIVWLGTKEGHLFELDMRTGAVAGARYAAHAHPVTHIFRHARTMVSLDAGGKALVFAPDGAIDVALAQGAPRVVRVPEKQEFARLLGGRLWTATRAEAHHAGTPARTPIIRVFDVLAPGAAAGRSMLPTEHVGAVTAATMLPSQPGYVYVGHEEGFITVWLLEGEDGHPKCIEVVKVSTSDILSLEGVHHRLWAGGRGGYISAYDVSARPWVVTNSWMAHPGLPVHKLSVDHYGIEKTGRLCVVSVGRDEHVKLWDGLLGIDWINRELMEREESFTRTRDINILLISWNADAAKPEMLSSSAANVNFLTDALRSVASPDIISFGFQEVIDLESRKMVAKNVIMGGKKKADDGGLSEKVTRAYKRWFDHLQLAVRLAMSPDTPYTVVHTESLVGMFSCIFIKNSERALLKDLAITTIKRGMGGRYGNKGGIVARFVIADSSICLINCHLAAGQHGVRQRNSDVAAILEEKSVFPVGNEPLAYVGGGDGSMILDHEIVFFSGDMNYRIDQRRDTIVAAVRAGELESLLAHDQLLKEMRLNRGFRFRGFAEGALTFAPTYKYDRRSKEYDSSEKRRAPAWCDRVLWRAAAAGRVRELNYRRWEADLSDHRPISAGFVVGVKSIRQEVRQKVKAEVEVLWGEEHGQLLAATREFYVAQSVI